jgi:hypothetical protein
MDTSKDNIAPRNQTSHKPQCNENDVDIYRLKPKVQAEIKKNMYVKKSMAWVKGHIRRLTLSGTVQLNTFARDSSLLTAEPMAFWALFAISGTPMSVLWNIIQINKKLENSLSKRNYRNSSSRFDRRFGQHRLQSPLIFAMH